ncbi:hypothetical protein SAMN05421505_101222 [Sinosporangium album]|uniref:Uncharacterized protein n=1 Tax=Sinosporangium album TaxID=504805 RepID=A0A1G7R2M1_9ACTN|nr:hypothetical protein SAMN05421505_101222 [Sinosporangium album]
MGLGATVVARRQPGAVWVWGSAVLVVIGLVMLTPWLVRFTGRAAKGLRLPLRVSACTGRRPPPRWSAISPR